LRSFKGVSPKLGKRVYIDPAAIVIGNVHLDDDCSIWPGAVIRGDMHKIKIGVRCNIQDNAVLHITHASEYNPDGWPLTMGSDVIVGHSAVLHGCTLGSKILIGNGAILNDGVIAEDHVMVGAGCMVPPKKTLESGFVYVGNPCRVLRPISDKEKEFLTYSPNNYVKLKNIYLGELTSSNVELLSQ